MLKTMNTDPTLDLALVLVASNQADTLGATARRLHQYVTYTFGGTWQMIIVDHASSDTTWEEAQRVAGMLSHTSVLHLDQQLSRKELRELFVTSPAVTAAFLEATTETDLDVLLAPILRSAAVVSSSGMSRRGLLAGIGGLGATALLAACGSSATKVVSSVAPAVSTSPTTAAATTTSSAAVTTTSAAPPSTTTSTTVAATAAPGAVTLAAEITEGPYWLDLNLVRPDIREDRKGVTLQLALNVVDIATGKPIRDASVDIWHCDADGVYSGFAGASVAANGGGVAAGGQGALPAGPPPGAPAGGGAFGPGRAQKTDDSTFLRGIQLTDASGKAAFTTIYPGWYNGRTVHIHVKVNVTGKTIHTGQFFFNDTFTDGVFQENSPYSARPARSLRNDGDGIFQGGGAGSVLVVTKDANGYAATMTMGVTA